MFEFAAKGRYPILLDAPFEVRLIPADQRDLTAIDNPAQRLFVMFLIVDSQSMILRGIRGVTLAPGTTRAFLATAQDQLADNRDDASVRARLNALSLEALRERTEMLPCG